MEAELKQEEVEGVAVQLKTQLKCSVKQEGRKRQQNVENERERERKNRGTTMFVDNDNAQGSQISI